MEKVINSQLTPWERRMVALGDLPPDAREEVLWGLSNPPLISLSNETAAAPTEVRGLESLPQNGTDHRESESVPALPALQVDGPASLLERWPAEMSQDHRRIVLESCLNENFPGVDWSADPWHFIEVFKDSAREVFKIRNSSFDPYRVFNFRRCYRKKTVGEVLTSVQAPHTRYRRRKRCQEPGCLDCWDTARLRLAGEKVKILKKVMEANPGGPGILEIGPTLPENVEHLPLQDKAIEKKLLDGLHEIVRDLFGVTARSNILAYVSVHPVGDRDVFRDRWHPHIQVLPGHVTKDLGTGKRRFEWLEPRFTAPGHKKSDWRIDLVWLRERWNRVLSSVFGDGVGTAICPEISFVSNSDDAPIYRRKPKEKGRIFWGRVANKIKYSMRGWGKDFEEAALRTAGGGRDFFILKAERETDKRLHWTVCPADACVERWKWVKKHNRIITWGFGQALKKYGDVLGLVDEPESAPPEVVSVLADVELIREKRFDRDSGRVKWIRDEIYTWVCPFTGQKFRMSKRDLVPWKCRI